MKNIRRATRKRHSSEEKIRIVLDGLRGESSIAELCRREGIAEGLYYAWSLPPRPRLRPIRGHLKPSPRATSCVPMPREEWIEIPVPSIVDPAVFEATRVQLEENRKRKRERARGQCWLLQGLTVCRCCGYAYYGKTAPRSRKYDPMNALRYYRCTGADGYRFSGKAVCHNGPLRGDQLEQAIWDQVRALLEEPHRVAGEYRRRITQARDGATMPEERSFASIGR